MALYEITQDCRIANNEYQKWDVVSDTEVGGYYPSIMKLTNWQKPEKKEKVVVNEVKEEVKEDKKPSKKRKKK